MFVVVPQFSFLEAKLNKNKKTGDTRKTKTAKESLALCLLEFLWLFGFPPSFVF